MVLAEIDRYECKFPMLCTGVYYGFWEWWLHIQRLVGEYGGWIGCGVFFQGDEITLEK